MREGLAKAAGHPLVQFLVLGALFYGLYAWIGGPGPANQDKVIRVTASEVNRLEALWLARGNRPPTDDELEGIVRGHIREIAMYRHAVAMGLDQNDPVIRRMVGQKLETLTQNLVELSLSPTEQELRTYFDANSEGYRPPDLITLTQIFLDPDRRGEQTLEDAEEILTGLRSLADPTKGIESLGDPFMLQSYYPSKSEFEIARFFGQGFAESVFELSPNQWHGPVLSGYGTHLVYVHHFEESPPPDFAVVEEQVKQDWLYEKQKEFREAYANEILAGYEVVFEDIPPESPARAAVEGPEASE